MLNILPDLTLFFIKTIIIFVLIVGILIAFFAIATKGKGGTKNKLKIKNLNKKFDEQNEELLTEMLNKKEMKAYRKQQKQKAKTIATETRKNVYVMDFHGDIKASQVDTFARTITAVLSIATPKDEIVLRLENAGGYVHTHGLASAQLMRIREKNIPLTVTIDKIAASGGYLMACVGNKILASPFAIIGSIGVVVQLPNFHRLLKDKHIDYVQLTAGEYKRTVTVFGENTAAGREKLTQEINEVHTLFKNTIQHNRPKVNIEKVATGEHWLGQIALQLQLVDEIKTSDSYLAELKDHANLYEIGFETKKSMLAKLVSSASLWREKIFSQPFYQ